MDKIINQDADDPALGEKGYRHEVYYQGQLLVWRVWRIQPPRPKPKKRKECRGLSAAARFRMLKMVAGIDWNDAGRCAFITLTYPDHYQGMHYRQMGIQRWMFWRQVEAWAGKNVAAIWRIEWKPRKTGQWKGELMPHVHMITFREKYLQEDEVRTWWGKAIGWENYVDVDLEWMSSPKQVGMYVAKYVGKETRVLGNASYLSKIPPGRQWGKLRADGFPMMEYRVARFQDSAMTDWCRAKALDGRPRMNDFGNESFTLLGPTARYIGESIFGKWVDGEIPCY